ncbi:MAG TPA: SLBB domain-containing protein [Candidatus Limnocylindria bacterium]|nr:SLBB domain-containing protein [Candidatus Limnocylindria bacterium]
MLMVLALESIRTQEARAADEGFVQSDREETPATDMEQRRLLLEDLSKRVVAGPVDPETFVVGPGDVFQLMFSGRLSRQDLLVVGPEGSVLLPGVGRLRLAGLTLAQARASLERAVNTEYRGVDVDLQLAQVRNLRVDLTGEVKMPGALQLPATSRVSDVLATVELTERASRRNIEVRRMDGSMLNADLALFNRNGRYQLNPYMLDGDIVRIQPATDFVEIWGAVVHPARYELGPADSLRTLFELAGGPLPATLLQGALLVRWLSATQAESVFFSVDDVYGRRFNPPMSEGERVYVYFTPAYHELHQASILGEVERPGTYPLVLGRTRLSDLVTSAGGFRVRADLSTIRVFRKARRTQENDIELDRLSRLSRSEMTDTEYEVLRTRLSARREDFRVDWSRLAQSPELDILITDGDEVRVDPILASVRVEGEVRRPGLVDFDSQHGVRDYVRLAGGFANRAAPGKVLITRTVTGQTLRVQDVQAIAPGDMIWVPERPDKTFWENFQTLVTVAAQVATVIIAVRR